MPPRTPVGYFNQTYAIEFEVTGSLDGTTLSPEILDSPPSGQNPDDPQNLFRRSVENLGIIDPDYLVTEEARLGARGNRLVGFIWIEGPGPGAADASVDLVDALGGTPVVQKAQGTFVGSPTFYKEAIFIPQGSALRVRGLVASPGAPIKVRLHVQFLDGAEDLAAAFAISGQQQTLGQVLKVGNQTDGRNMVVTSGDRIDFQSTFLVNNNMQPLADNSYRNGALGARWSATVSRLAVAVSLTGLGTTEALYGGNSVGIVSGAADAVTGATARLQMANPASPAASASLVLGGANAEVVGGLAEVSASGVGAKAFGSARAETAHNARLRATGPYAFAGGVARAYGYDATVEATGEAALAFGYARSYPAYGTVQLRAGGTGAVAFGTAQYFADINASGLGCCAQGNAFGLSGRVAEITAMGKGDFAQGMAAGGSLIASGYGSFAQGYARTGTVGVERGVVQATGLGAHAFGVAVANDYNATVEATTRGAFANGYAGTIVGDTGPARVGAVGGIGGGSTVFGVAFYGDSLLEASSEGSFVAGAALGYDTGQAEIIANEPGAWAGGLAAGTGGSVGSIRAEENGAFAQGKAVGGDIHATQEGSRAHGVIVSGRNIRATGLGSVARGSARNVTAGDILASAEGAQAHGFADGVDIVASAVNAFQFGIGTNGLADSLKVGVGIHFKGSLGAPASPADGQFWGVVGGDVYVRTGGVTKNLSNIT